MNECKKEIIQLTFGSHSDGETFLQTTLLAFSPHIHIDLAVLAIFTHVHNVLSHAPPEET